MASESLRNQLEANYDKIVGGSDTPDDPATPPADPATVSSQEGAGPAAAAPVEPPKDGRERDEHGRFVAKPSEPPAAGVQQPPAQQQPQQPAAPAVQRPPRPSSWKKDYWDHWEKLDPKLAEYLHQRESEFAKGVSTYKTEWERAKPLLDAVAPYQGDFQRWGIDPAQQFTKYVEIHKALALGSPEQKVSTFLRLAQDYQIPVQNLFVQGQDGRLYFNPQVQQQQQHTAQQPQQRPEEVRKLVQEALAEHTTQQEVERMKADAKTYPHFEQVRQTMSGLLQAGLAQDLHSAYEAALRMPAHSDLWDAMQQQQREAQEKEKAEQARKAAEAAKRNQVSPRTATPLAASPGAKKGLRATLEDAVEQHTAGRV